MYTVNNSEQLRELSSNDLNFLDNDDDEDSDDNQTVIEANGNDTDLVGKLGNSTVRDLDNILDKFEADTQLLLNDPNQLLNCKYTNYFFFNQKGKLLSIKFFFVALCPIKDWRLREQGRENREESFVF